MTSPELSVVLPVRDQADHIRRVVESYLDVLDRSVGSYELVLVPNACTDGSDAICRELAMSAARVRVLENPRGGWGLSVRTGLAGSSGRFVCYTNSARTDPSLIPRMLDLARTHPGLVKVVRCRRGNRVREFGSFLYNLECRLLFDLPGRDVNGTPKLFPRSLLEGMHLTSDGDLLDLEILVECRRLGVRVLEVPVQGWRRHGGRSSTGLASAWRMYAGAIRLRFKSMSGPIFSPPGVLP